MNGSPHGRVTGGAGRVTITGLEVNPNLAAGRDPRLAVSVDGRAPITVAVDEPNPATAGPNALSAALADYHVVVPAATGQDQGP